MYLKVQGLRLLHTIGVFSRMRASRVVNRAEKGLKGEGLLYGIDVLAPKNLLYQCIQVYTHILNHTSIY